jgi:HSP20 family protein
MVWEITPWRPFEFERLRKEMDRLWDSFFEGRPRVRIGEWFPSLDVAETKNDIVVKVELPGMDQKDIDVSLSDGHLIIKGEKKQEKEEKEGDYLIRSFMYSSITLSISIIFSTSALTRFTSSRIRFAFFRSNSRADRTVKEERSSE